MAALRDYSQYISENDRKFVLESLYDGIRLDARDPLQHRDIKYNFGRLEGKSRLEVSFGNTKVLAVVSAEVVAPFPDRPNEGFLDVSTFVSPMASSSFDSNRTSELSVEIANIVEKGLKETRAVDLEALCIVAASKVWSVRCDITVLDHDGNVIDPAMLAAVGALLHFRKPDVSVVGDQVTIHALNEREPVPLAVHFIPLCVTFGFFEKDELLVIDPTFKEELVMQGSGSFVLNSHQEICGVHKHGLPALAPDLIVRCIRAAASKYEAITDQLNKALEEAELAAKEKILQKSLKYSSVYATK